TAKPAAPKPAPRKLRGAAAAAGDPHWQEF
ncbi:hypothetical protein EDC50_3218, partial [Vulcaniibacterium tengchongense]